MLRSHLLLLFLAAFSLGVIVFTICLRRAGAVPVWVPVAAIIMSVANFAGELPAGIVQLVALLAAFAPIVVVVLRGTPRQTRSAVPSHGLEPAAS